ncbi:MAG: DUF1631 domain-containing protein [Gammaproteobacteria bacterium]|nr:DUF1631 domain-containing protein [Gammaproteobacteria bacterium]MBU1654454.1 DUF1631 domain-containing protein [Gammaproteobacteria bacterium]MBU1962612.1 DUF1631 domain-containing protein [Gammaproteobacteria bacterium]
MGQTNNVVSFFGTEKSGSGKLIELDENARRLVRECRALVEGALGKMVQGLFEKLDDALFRMAEKSESNAKQTDFFAAMRELRKARQEVGERFSDSVLSGYDAFWRSGPLPARSAKDAAMERELSLVGEEDFEESLAINSMASRGERLFSRDLFAFKERIAHLMKLDGETLDERMLPVAPAAVCAGFGEAMGAVQVPIDIRLVVYKLFEKEVVSYLGGLYDEINAILVRGGVLPKLSHKFKRNPVSPALAPQGHAPVSPERTEAESALAAEMGYEEEADAIAAGQIYNSLRQLLGARANATAGFTHVQGGASLPPVETRELLEALGNIQEAVRGADIGPDEVPRLSDVRKDLLRFFSIGQGGSARKGIGKPEEEVIDIISMLFDFILEDHALPDQMKVLLSRLQIPMVKLAVIDKSFFSKKSHPARKLLNGLAQAAARWDTTVEAARDPLYREVETVVQRVLDDFEDNPGLFSELNDRFSAFVSAEDSRLNAAEERATQVNKGRERLESARSRAGKEIKDRLDGAKTVPEVVRNLLEGPWRDVVSLVYLRNGVESEQWGFVLSVVDRLIWSVQPKTDPQERKRMLAEIPAILKDLRDNLSAISYDQRSMSSLFKDLQTTHIACLRNEPPKPNDRPSGNEQAIREESISALVRGASAGVLPDSLGLATESNLLVIEDQHQELAETAKVGSWFEFKQQDDAPPSRLKLSWRSGMTDLCVFVNRQGMKAAELRVPELAQGLREYRIHLIKETEPPLLVDRAMNAMVEALKRSREVLSEAGGAG